MPKHAQFPHLEFGAWFSEVDLLYLALSIRLAKKSKLRATGKIIGLKGS
jgi:hypothetical protein